VPRGLDGFRTLFNAFHHFRPELARRILADAVAARRPIAVFEVVSRRLLPLVGLLLSPLNVLVLMPFVRPRRWSWLFFTYVVPVIPLFVLWDGVVSWLRIYSEPELRAPPGSRRTLTEIDRLPVAPTTPPTDRIPQPEAELAHLMTYHVT
jgi:hypothetical protein